MNVIDVPEVRFKPSIAGHQLGRSMGAFAGKGITIAKGGRRKSHARSRVGSLGRFLQLLTTVTSLITDG